MKLRDMMFLVIGGLLVISGMVLNTLISGDAEAQVGVKDGRFRYITCEGLILKDGSRMRGLFGLNDSRDAILVIFGDDGKTEVAYLGKAKESREMMFELSSKSKTDKGMVRMILSEWGGMMGCFNKMGEGVAAIAVGDDGGGHMFTRDKYGYTK